MNAATLSQPLLMAGGVLLDTVRRAGQWTFARYMRAPLASTGLLAMVTMTALAGSNALYFQTAMHPTPFFAPARDALMPVSAPAPTSVSERPAADVLPPIEEAREAVTAPAVSPETTGTVSVPVFIPDEPVGNATMFAVQKKLFELNLFSGQIDGYYGPKTAEAIRAFEVRNGMPATGEFDQAVMEAIIASDGQGRVSQPAATPTQPQAVQTPIPAAQPVPIQVASAAPVQVAAVAPPQDQVVARLPALSPAEQAFDNVAQSAASTIDSIIANVDAPRSAPEPLVSPPVPRAEVASAPVTTQPMPQPVVQAARQTTPAPAPAAPAPQVQQTASVTPAVSQTPVRPATDEELVSQIQRGLASLGFYHGQIDGRPSTETARAIREFENFHRYRMTGQVQPDLVDLLVKAGATI